MPTPILIAETHHAWEGIHHNECTSSLYAMCTAVFKSDQHSSQC